jgi:hypothetical protein
MRILCLSSAIVWLSVSGCTSNEVVRVLGNGYEEVTRRESSVINEPIATKVALRYKPNSGKAVPVWNVVRSKVFITEKCAVFIGDRSIRWSKDDQIWEMEPRVFAVEAPETPVDITSEILRRWAKTANRDSKVIFAANLIGATQTPDKNLDLYFEFNGGVLPGTHITVTWDQILEMLQKSKSEPIRKDPVLNEMYRDLGPKPGTE